MKARRGRFLQGSRSTEHIIIRWMDTPQKQGPRAREAGRVLETVTETASGKRSKQSWLLAGLEADWLLTAREGGREGLA